MGKAFINFSIFDITGKEARDANGITCSLREDNKQCSDYSRVDAIELCRGRNLWYFILIAAQISERNVQFCFVFVRNLILYFFMKEQIAHTSCSFHFATLFRGQPLYYSIWFMGRLYINSKRRLWCVPSYLKLTLRKR